MAKAKQPTPPATLGASLNGLFNKMSNKKPITQDEVKNAFALLLQEDKNVTSDAQIIDAMKILIKPLPPEQHFDVWKSSDENFNRLYRDENSDDGEPDCASPLGLFVMDRMLDSLEDLPRNRRAEAASSCVYPGFGIPVTPDIQKSAIDKVLTYIPYAQENASIIAETTSDYTEDRHIGESLLRHALSAVEDPNTDGETPFEYARACTHRAYGNGFEDLTIEAFNKALKLLPKIPDEDKEEQRVRLLETFDGKHPKIDERVQRILDATERKVEPNPVANFLAQAKTLG